MSVHQTGNVEALGSMSHGAMAGQGRTKAGQGRAWQGRAGQGKGRGKQGRAGESRAELRAGHWPHCRAQGPCTADIGGGMEKEQEQEGRGGEGPQEEVYL